MNEKEKIYDELQEVLKNDKENVDRILALSNKLALTDKEKVRFSVDSGIIDRLGKELVARQETAVSELIKNAYDADASTVKLRFYNVNAKGGRLIIEDDGHGMSNDELINGFMRLSSTSKVHAPLSPSFNRKRAGQKGIGRFATQRLGDKLSIITATNQTKTALKIEIDWDKFIGDSDLNLISHIISDEPKIKPKGTTLIIDNLREWWSDAMIKRVYRYSLDIIEPFPLSKSKFIEGKLLDPGFKIECFLDDVPIDNPTTFIYDQAVAEITGEINNHGAATWEIPNCKFPEAITSRPQVLENKTDIYKYLSGVKITAYYYIYSSDLLPKQIETYIRSIASEQAGIRLYRNGFRVLPFGEKDNDWLGLDASVRKRTILPVHSNNNFFGFISIDNSNQYFNELSSREGLFVNDAYVELTRFGYEVLISAVSRIASARGIKTTTSQKAWNSKYSKSPTLAVLDTADILEDIANEIEGEKNSENDNSNTNENNDRQEQNSERQEQNRERAENLRDKAKLLRAAVESIGELNMLRVLAGLGLIIGEFTHEIMNYINPIEIDATFLVNNLNTVTKEYSKALRLKTNFSSFKVYASYFDHTISANVNRELISIELRDVITPFFETISQDLEKNGIETEITYKSYGLFTCKMHTSEWASILFNLYSNSKKALKRSEVSHKKILVVAGDTGENLFVQFCDNGDGIPEENRDKIFAPFFTTSNPKTKANAEYDDLTGTGLGLKIVKDIVESYNGDIFVDNPPDAYSTCIRIEIPKLD